MVKKGNVSASKKLFNIGALLAIILGIGSAMGATWATSPWLLLALIVVGLVAGWHNVAKESTHSFLLGVVALTLAVAVTSLTTIDKVIPKVGTFIQATLGNFVVVVGAAAIIVALRTIYGHVK